MSGVTPQVILLGIALVTGALLDHVLVGNRVATLPANTPVAVTHEDAASTEALAPLPAAATPLSKVQRTSDNANVPRPSLESILAAKNSRERTRELQAYVNSLHPGEFSDAIKRLRQISNSNERELVSRLLVAQWVATDPDGALQFAAANRGYEYLADDVFQQRAATDFQSALTQAQEIPGNDLRYRALRGILSFKADSDPTGAIQLAQSLGPFPGNEPLTNVLYRQWAASDPQSAALYATQQGEQGGWRSPVNQVVNTWAQQDPVAAANWSLGLPDSQAQGRALSQVMRDWGRQDPTATANWIQGLPAGTSHDSATAGFAEAMVFADPQNALNWVGTITDDGMRQRTLQQISRQVLWRDPQNGPAMLQAAGLSPDQIRTGPPRPGGGR